MLKTFMQLGSNPCLADQRSSPAPSDSSPDSSASFRLRPQDQRRRTWPATQNVPQPFPAPEKRLEPSSRDLWFPQYPASTHLLRPPHDTSPPLHAFPAQAGKGGRHPKRALPPSGCVPPPHKPTPLSHAR